MDDRSPARVQGQRLVRLALPFYALLAGLAVLWRWGVRGAWLFDSPAATGLGAPLDSRAASVGLGLAVGLVVVGLSQIWTKLWPSGESVARMLGEAVGDLRGRECVALALASGFAEEMFFRGALQPEVGLTLASIGFGLAHLVPRWPLVLWSLFAVVIGVLFGAMFEWTGSLWAPVTAHVVVNGVNLPLLSRRYGRG